MVKTSSAEASSIEIDESICVNPGSGEEDTKLTGDGGGARGGIGRKPTAKGKRKEGGGEGGQDKHATTTFLVEDLRMRRSSSP
jgi:hypothetical protein|eukprot:4965590-Prymnesium_polylepis.1